MLKLLNIKSTPIQPTYKDHLALYGPIRPLNFPSNLKKNYNFSDLELFLHELITYSSIAWLMERPLNELRNQIDDINQVKSLLTKEKTT